MIRKQHGAYVGFLYILQFTFNCKRGNSLHAYIELIILAREKQRAKVIHADNQTC